MNDVQILNSCVNRLNNICVPVGFTEEISMPLREVSHDLEILLDTVLKAVRANQEKAEKSGEEAPEDDAERISEDGNGQDPA